MTTKNHGETTPTHEKWVDDFLNLSEKPRSKGGLLSTGGRLYPESVIDFIRSLLSQERKRVKEEVVEMLNKFPVFVVHLKNESVCEAVNLQKAISEIEKI